MSRNKIVINSSSRVDNEDEARRRSSSRRILIEGEKCRLAGVYSRINRRDWWSTIKVENCSGMFYVGQDGRCADLVKPNIIKHKNIPRRREGEAELACLPLPERGKVNKKCSLLQ